MRKEKWFIMLTAFLIAAVLFAGCESAAVKEKVAEYNEDIYFSDPNSGYSGLKENEKAAYVRIHDALLQFDSKVDVERYDLTVDALEKIWIAIDKDDPTIFWCQNNSYTAAEDQVIAVYPKYELTAEEKDALTAEIETVKNQYCAMVAPEWDDYEKVKTIHDALLSATVYDPEAPDNQNIRSVLLNNRSVCAGYSKAFQYILNQLGIYCTIVNGTNDVGELHCWNLVKMDGDYYYFDITNDDSADGRISYTYFGLTTDELLTHCSIDERFTQYSLCMATQDNYYVRENKIYTEDGFLQALDQLIARHGTEMTGKCPSCSNLQSVIDQIPYRYPNAFTSIRYTKDDALHTIDLLINY